MRKIFALLIIALFSITSCIEDEIPTSEEKVNEALYSIMHEMYYWYKSIPSGIDYKDYLSPEVLLNDMRYELDRWSYVTDKASFDAYYHNGSYYGLGFGMKFDQDNQLRVSFLYNSSPLKLDEVKRGWIIHKINGSPITSSSEFNSVYKRDLGESNLIEFIKPDGELFENTYTIAEIEINSIVHSEIIDLEGKKIGYFVFKGFIEPSIQELSNLFSEYKAEGVSELVLDLRYNGGGQVDVASHLAGYIIKESANGKSLVTYTHNDKNSDRNRSINLDVQPETLGLENLYVISTSSTASASELIINGLKPYMNVVLIGGKTHGKPVGMYAFDVEDYVILPICFSTLNSNGEGDYFNGIPVDYEANDNLSKVWGDREEDCLQTALELISGKSFKRGIIKEQRTIKMTGLQEEIGAF